MTHEAAPTVASTSAPSTTSPHAPAGSLETQGSAGRRYLANAAALVDQLLERTWPSIVDAADVITAALHAGRSLHAFGTGHSHMLAEELYYRAGGLVAVRPILFDGLMLHTGARRSTDLERLPGLAAVLLDDHGMAPGDVLIVASNSGGNAVSTELASLARERGATVIAVSSLAHARSAYARPTDRPRLHEIAHVVIDNGGAPGDASTAIDGVPFAVGPTSTVVGAAIVNAVIVETVQRLVALGTVPPIYTSSNLLDGDSLNAASGRPG